MKTYRERVEECKRRLIKRALRMTQGNVPAAAKLLDLERTHLYSLAKQHGISAADFRQGEKPKEYFGVKVAP